MGLLPDYIEHHWVGWASAIIDCKISAQSLQSNADIFLVATSADQALYCAHGFAKPLQMCLLRSGIRIHGSRDQTVSHWLVTNLTNEQKVNVFPVTKPNQDSMTDKFAFNPEMSFKSS